MRLSSRTNFEPNVYGALVQKLDGLKPECKYELTVWIKGDSVSNCTIAVGPGWKLRKSLPEGTYDWRSVTFLFETPKDMAGSFPLVFIVEGPTDGIWIDDISLMEDSQNQSISRFYEATICNGIPQDLHYYPSPYRTGSPGVVPVLSFRSEDNSFGADSRITWDEKYIHFNVDVIDPSAGNVLLGDEMWRGDSIQLHVQVDDAVPVELNFALQANGEVSAFTWDASIDLEQIKKIGRRSSSGYSLGISLPWREFAVPAGKLPSRVAANIVVNDSGLDNKRNFVEWTPATAVRKDPEALANVVLSRDSDTNACDIKLSRSFNDLDDPIEGWAVTYAYQDQPDTPLHLQLSRADGEKIQVFELPTGFNQNLSGQTKRMAFSLVPDSPLPEGDYQFSLVMEGDEEHPLAFASFHRIDAENRIREGIRSIQAQSEKIRESVDSLPVSDDSYVIQGLTIVEIFLKRFEGSDAISSDWKMLQVEELQKILAYLEARISKLSEPELIVRKQSNEAGAPAFIYGFGHWDQPFKDMPELSKIGVDLVQREFGSIVKKERASKTITAAFARAESCKTMVDFHLSPHYIPSDLIKKDVTMALDGAVSAGFIKYNIDHPESRKLIQDWVDCVLPLVKDSPSLFSVGLSNEPLYSHSGRDVYSRSIWTKYLEGTHGSIDVLNVLYGTNYKSFDEVSPPDVGFPGTRAGMCAYYDWVIFNQKNFAEWHQWLNDIVKQQAPGIPTHAKVMPLIFRRSHLHEGMDPELICDITDLAGNDCWAYYQSSNRFAYRWELEEMWYDLLHSFRGQPVYNSENHLIKDGAPATSIPPEHTYSVLWQGALHNMEASAIWVWNPPVNSALEGSIYMRPGNVRGAGKAILDINRLKPEIQAINRAKAPVAILYSVTSIFWQKNYEAALMDLYRTLSLGGNPVTFISEKQLSEGKRSTANDSIGIIALPQTTHVKRETILALEEFVESGGSVVALGQDNLSFDQYGRPHRPEDLKAIELVEIQWSGARDQDGALTDALSSVLGKMGIRTFPLRDANTGDRVSGVEYRSVEYDGGLLMSMINHTKSVVTVSVPSEGSVYDLLNQEVVEPTSFVLEPMQPRLVSLEFIPSGIDGLLEEME